MLRAIMGLQRTSGGQVTLDDVPLSGMPPHRRAALGLRLIPQDQVVFPGLSVKEHLELARVSSKGGDGDQWLELFPVLQQRLSQKAETLIGGAEFLLMDEPTEGVQPSIVELIAESLARIATQFGVLLVEQNLDVIAHIGGFGYVMEKGHVAASGPVEELDRNGSLDRYLGI
jgi:ABC-type branched-subunit amino acid transport system ATPase component